VVYNRESLRIKIVPEDLFFPAVVFPGMHKITARRKELLAKKMRGGLNPVRKTSSCLMRTRSIL
jgi:hypothetical protein